MNGNRVIKNERTLRKTKTYIYIFDGQSSVQQNGKKRSRSSWERIGMLGSILQLQRRKQNRKTQCQNRQVLGKKQATTTKYKSSLLIEARLFTKLTLEEPPFSFFGNLHSYTHTQQTHGLQQKQNNNITSVIEYINKRTNEGKKDKTKHIW